MLESEGTQSQNYIQLQWEPLKKKTNSISNSWENLLFIPTYFITSDISFPFVTLPTCADHSPHWQSVLNNTISVGCTRSIFKTRVFTLIIVASELARTISINNAKGFFNNWLRNLKIEFVSKNMLSQDSALNLLGTHSYPYGSPVKLGIQVQNPLWFLGLHSALIAHSHGSTHFSFLHVRVVGQSGSRKHSGFRHEM